MPIKLTNAQVEEYNEKGYIVVEGVLSPEKLAKLREETDKIIAAASPLRRTMSCMILKTATTHQTRASAGSRNPIITFHISGIWRKILMLRILWRSSSARMCGFMAAK